MLDPDECLLTPESSDASWVPVDDIDGVPSLIFFCDFFSSLESGGFVWRQLCEGVLQIHHFLCLCQVNLILSFLFSMTVLALKTS